MYQYHFYFSEDSPVKSTTILLHVTPYGPSITDVMPYYTVLEFETSRDRRGQWSEFVAKSIWQGPPVLEGYCYQGAFFSPHQFAELKEMYDKQLLAYETSWPSRSEGVRKDSSLVLRMTGFISELMEITPSIMIFCSRSS